MSTSTIKKRGGRHWHSQPEEVFLDQFLDAHCLNLGRKIRSAIKEHPTASKRALLKVASLPSMTDYFHQATVAAPEPIRDRIRVYSIQMEVRRAFISKRFRERKTLAIEASSTRMRYRKIARIGYKSVLNSDAFYQFVLKTVVIPDASVETSIASLVKLMDWLRIACTFYYGGLCDPHRLAAAINGVRGWDVKGIDAAAAEVSASDPPSIFSNNLYWALLFGKVFDPKYLGSYKGSRRSVTRGWIIRQLNSMVSPTLTKDDGRYAVIAGLLSYSAIPATPVIVKDALRKRR